MPRTDKEHARAQLADIQPDETIYWICRKATGSGWRHYDFYVMRDNAPHRITGPVCTLTGYSYSDKEHTLRTNGYANEVIYHLSYHLFGNEYRLKAQEI